MNLSENLRKIRKENNLSQEQLAEKLGVSRQAVSKWESSQAYPEMDKVLQIAQMFHLNIDDLLNQDIGEVNSEKQSKTAMNKYIDDFLSFITKTVDMFSSMKRKDRARCIMEQILIICVSAIILSIIGGIGDNILTGFTHILPNHIEMIIHSILESIYLIISFILVLILLIHIFKTRYLDYYEIIKEEKKEEIVSNDKKNKQEVKKGKVEEDNDKHTTYSENKKEKVVIRDPKHSEYKFISGMMKALLWCIKGIVLLFVFSLCCMLIGLVITLVMSFLIIKTGIFFIGILITILACIIMTVLFLVVALNFVMNRKSKKKMILITFIISIIIMGFGSGLTVIGFTEFDYVDDINNQVYKEDELIIPMQEDLIIYDLYYYHNNSIIYVEEDREDIRISYKHTDYYNLSYEKYNSNQLELYITNTDSNILKTARDWLKDINDKKIINYGKVRLYLYASKDNLEKLKQNTSEYFEERREYSNCYDRLYEQNMEYENKIYEYENRIDDLEEEIEKLKQELNYYGRED